EIVQQIIGFQDRYIAAETREYNLAFVSNPVPIDVFEVKDFRSRRHKDSTVVASDSRWQSNVVSKDCVRIKYTVAVSVLEQANASKMGRLIATLRIIPHFGDEQPPIFVKGHGRGRGYSGIVGGKLDMEALFETETGKGVRRANNWCV